LYGPADAKQRVANTGGLSFDLDQLFPAIFKYNPEFFEVWLQSLLHDDTRPILMKKARGFI
jgi:hypothetical protein